LSLQFQITQLFRIKIKKENSVKSLFSKPSFSFHKTVLTAALGTALFTSGCTAIPGVSLNLGILLVSAAEVEKYKGDITENITIPLAGDEPAIEIVRPVVREGKVASPVAIEVRFKPVTGKAIDPASFKLYYGAFKIDVTDRLLKTAKVTPTGFSIDKVDIPAGSHRLVMKVADDTGAAGIKEIKFTVDGA
jgi:hypothetical protein